MIAFANPWGLLGLLAVPAVLWLHLYRVRFPPRAVGGLFLWDDAIRRPAGGRTRDRLRSTASLWLELLAAAALGLLLAGPRIAWETEAPHLIAVVDGSASMTATVADGDPTTFRDAALAALADRAAAAGSGALLTIIETGDRPRVIGGPRRPWRAALDEYADRPAPVRPRHGFAPALDLAARLADGGGRVWLLTDRDLRTVELPETVAAVSVGAPRPNVALLAAERRPSDGGGESLFVRVRRFGGAGPVLVVVSDGKGVTLVEERLPLSPGGTSVELSLPAGAAGAAVTVRLVAEEDALAADSTAVLLPEPSRPVRVAIDLPDGPNRRAVERAVDAVPGVALAGAGPADLRFVPVGAAAGGRTDQTWSVAVGPLSGGTQVDTGGPFLVDRSDPLAAGLSLAGTVWGGAGEAGSGGAGMISPVVAAAGRSLFGRVTGDERAFVLNVDAARGTLAETPDWPILVSNLIDLRRDSLPGPDRVNLRLGETGRLVLSADRLLSPQPLLLSPAAESVVASDSMIELPRESVVSVSPPAAGLWAVRDGRTEVARFAARLADPREADLTGSAPGETDAEADGTVETAVDDPAPWLVGLLAVVALGAVVGDWRVTRPG